MLHGCPTSTDVGGLHQPLLSPAERNRKRSLWNVLCKHFLQRYIRATDVVVDLGAGYGDFINQIQCAKKYAVDLNDETADAVSPDVIFLKQQAIELDGIGDSSVDVVFASNLFEHLRSKEEILLTLREVRRILRPGGKLLVLQPNIRYAFREYWDYLDHHLALSHESMAEALKLTGFTLVERRARFLPFSTSARLPQYPLLLRIYLRMRVLHWLLGKQMFLVAAKAES